MSWPLTISVVLALVGNGNLLWARGPQPHDADTAHIASPHGRVEILRDRDGVPHIRAKSEWEALFGLGYAHAQDRLWQMEFQRRLGNGRLSEILGDGTLPTDKLFRTVGLHRTAAAVWANFSPEERQPVEAYVAGVNAYLNNRPNNQLPSEFGLLGIEPEPWRPEDVLAWSKVVAWGQGSNWDHELLRAQLIPRLGAEKTAQLMPVYTADGPVILPKKNQHSAANRQKTRTAAKQHSSSYQSSTLNDLLALNRTIERHLGLGADGFGSNNWVLGGERTTTGKPILANDPHLTAQTPSFWYLAHVTGGDLDVIGATIPGAPGVQIGHNGHISWGITTINVDSQDIYIERVNENNEAEYNGALNH
jgi:penicillin G amidase